VFTNIQRLAVQFTLAALGLIACAGLPACSSPSQSSSKVVAPPSANATQAAPGTAEHPELGEAAVTEDALTAAVSTHLQAEATRQGGTLLIADPAQQRQLNLTLTTVHREGTRKLSDGRYFACAEFKGTDGNTYDLDVFMRPDLNGLTSDEIVIHKQNGRPRYDWVQTGGVWTRQPVTPQ
jgi:hypothetical protein